MRTLVIAGLDEERLVAGHGETRGERASTGTTPHDDVLIFSQLYSLDKGHARNHGGRHEPLKNHGCRSEKEELLKKDKMRKDICWQVWTFLSPSLFHQLEDRQLGKGPVIPCFHVGIICEVAWVSEMSAICP
jgi:hypothetical protein